MPFKRNIIIVFAVIFGANLLAAATLVPLAATTIFNLALVNAAVLALVLLAGERVERGLRETQAAARRAQNEAEQLLDRILEPLLIVDHTGVVVALNPAARLILKSPREELPGAAFTDLFTDPEAAMTLLDKTRSRGAVRHVTLHLVTVRGEPRTLLATGSLLITDYMDPGRIIVSRIIVSLNDVTHIQLQEQQSRQEAAYLRNLIEASQDSLLAISLAGIITDVNEVLVAQTGYARQKLVGKEFTALFDEPAAAHELYQHILNEARVQGHALMLRHRNGTRIPVMLNAARYSADSGTADGIFAEIRDTTRQQLVEAERVAAEWIKDGLAGLNGILLGQEKPAELARQVMPFLADYVGAQMGAFYLRENDAETEVLRLIASVAYSRRREASGTFLFGEGLVGQAALEQKQFLVADLPEDYFQIASGLGSARPRWLCVTPLRYRNQVLGVLEVAALQSLPEQALNWLEQAAEHIAVALEIAQGREQMGRALKRSQALTTELAAREEELQRTNAELEAYTVQLNASKRELQQQQQELEKSNAELETQTAELELSEQKLNQQQKNLELANEALTRNNALLERQKAALLQTQEELATQAATLARASRYKSEFLANMSHELRTPLNSLLLLARTLRDNPAGNLTTDQVESAAVIFDSGHDLLNLINDILDLAKIEAGRLELHAEEIDLRNYQKTLLAQFEPVAQQRGLALQIDFEANTPTIITSDPRRLGQILKNLISNALKFTESGGVTLTFGRPVPDTVLKQSGLNADQTLAIHVADTGIGIAADQHSLIFEAFQQAEKGDRRRYGGTGLGLSISRELVALLGGEIHLRSASGQGATFSVYLPLNLTANTSQNLQTAFPAEPSLSALSPACVPQAEILKPEHSISKARVPDDREHIQDTDQVILVIEDDTRFSTILARIVRERKLKCLVASSGEEGLELAGQYKPQGVILDIRLPGMDGWAVLQDLKQDVSLRHIPVHIVSVEESSMQNLRLGAIGHAAKPIDRERILDILDRLEAAAATSPKQVLLVEDDPQVRAETRRIIGNDTVTVVEADSGAAALVALRRERFALVILDLGLPDMQGLELLQAITREGLHLPPVIVHTARELTMEEEVFLRDYAESIVIKDIRSQERLIDEVALFLHRVVHELPEDNRRAILHLHESDEPLQGRKILIVEDDMRTMFAMARLLAGHGMIPLKAEQGERALALLEAEPDVDLVLLDIMMPVMDGYETLGHIRSQEHFAGLPVIALTAKAMPEDRQACIAAGATDYLTKPVDPDRLLSLMRVLLCR